MATGRNCVIVTSLFLNAYLSSEVALAHKGHTHEKQAPSSEIKAPASEIKAPASETKAPASETKAPEAKDQALLDAEISTFYRNNVEPILRKACFDCHSAETQFPWYSRLPFVRKLIQEDIAEARKHLDMTGGFPFKGHGSTDEDLKAIEEDIREGTMPPLPYRIMHFQSGLNNSEREKILNWTGESLRRLQN